MISTNKIVKGCGFHHLSMKEKDLEKSIEFYTSLGFVERVSWGEAPKRTVLLDTGDHNYFEISQGDPSQIYDEGVFKHIALRVDDCEAALAMARKAGAEVTVETREVTLKSSTPIPIRIAFFKGPDGELVELFQNEAT
jgi:catechol 2,3-dioxygenase-like lactoylglutathione lyase family enzyme